MPRGFLIGCVLGIFLGGGLALLVGGSAVVPMTAEPAGQPEQDVSSRVAPKPVVLPTARDDASPLPNVAAEPLREEMSASGADESSLVDDTPKSWLAGRVLDGSGQGIANAIVRAEMVMDEIAGGRPADTGFAPLSAAGRTSATGRFVLRGLLAGAEYRIGARSEGRPRMAVGGLLDHKFLKRTVIAPQNELVVPLSEVNLLLVFNLPSGLEDKLDSRGQLRLEVRIESEGGGSSSSSGSFPLEYKVGLVPDQKVTLTIRGEGFRDVIFKDLVLDDGEEIRRLEIDLKSALGASVVVLQISDDLGGQVNAAYIRSIRNDSERDPLAQGPRLFIISGPLHGEQGRFEVPGLMRGEQTLRVEGVEGSGFVPALVDIIVPEIGEVFRSVTLRRGGRLSLRLAIGQERISFGRIELRVDGEWRGQRIRLRKLRSINRGPIRELDPGLSYEALKILPPGSYGIRVHLEGEGLIEREFTISPGQVTNITLSEV